MLCRMGKIRLVGEDVFLLLQCVLLVCLMMISLCDVEFMLVVDFCDVCREI